MPLVSDILRASNLIRIHLERTVLKDVDLHWSAFFALSCLAKHGELETRRLAGEVGVAKSTLSSILNMLESRKLIRRRTNEEEQRLVIVNLTAAGADLLDSLSPRFTFEENRVVSRLSTRETRTSADAIQKVLIAIEWGGTA